MTLTAFLEEFLDILASRSVGILIFFGEFQAALGSLQTRLGNGLGLGQSLDQKGDLPTNEAVEDAVLHPENLDPEFVDAFFEKIGIRTTKFMAHLFQKDDPSFQGTIRLGATTAEFLHPLQYRKVGVPSKRDLLEVKDLCCGHFVFPICILLEGYRKFAIFLQF
jgi:hypothetical protein